MKAKLLFLFLCINVTVFGQGISVSNSYTSTQLVNDILINNTCGQAYNITSQGNCGIAYFNAENSNFPFSEGVIIRNGTAASSAGQFNGTTLSSVCSNLGDSELLAISQANGNTGTITDVSFLKFDFVSSSGYLNFDFIFASNEYGTFQCSFSDVFAFILTDLNTGISQNLAVIPGTTTPVSVTTIRNSAYNSACSSVNPQYFSTFSNNANPGPINMSGYTVPMTASATIIPNNPYSIKLVIGDYADSAYDSAVFINGGSFEIESSPNTLCHSEKINMVAFVDANNNGIKDANEINFNLGSFKDKLNDNSETTSQINSQNGLAYIYALNYADTHDLSFEINPEYSDYYTCSTTYNDLVIAAGSADITYNFPVINTVPYSDVAVTVLANQSAVTGFNQQNTVVYANHGTSVANGTLTLSHSTNVNLNTISESTAVPTSTGFTFNYTNLQPLESRTIQFNYVIPTIPNVELGDLITTNVTINAASNEVNATNNSFTLNKIIVGSYDPNDITESHGEKIQFSNFTNDEFLYYTIRFQNTGTAAASFVSLINNLPAELNPDSLIMINSSHDYNLTRKGNKLHWFFDAINLAPESINNDDSQGYVIFKVKPTAGFEVGTIIENTAEIYFDFNPAIITNTFSTEFIAPLNNFQFQQTDFIIYPNPTNSVLNIQNKKNGVISNVNVIDLLGKKLSSTTNQGNTLSIDLSHLNAGIYFIEIFTENSKTTHKIIKN